MIERTPDGYSAYVPDLPGCVAAADSYETAKQLIHEAVVFHLEALRGTAIRFPNRARPSDRWRFRFRGRAARRTGMHQSSHASPLHPGFRLPTMRRTGGR